MRSPISSRTKSQYQAHGHPDRKSTRLNSSHDQISYAVFCLKKKNSQIQTYSKNATWVYSLRLSPLHGATILMAGLLYVAFRVLLSLVAYRIPPSTGLLDTVF